MPNGSNPPFPERRQTPRVRCGGQARVISLPSEGLTVPGRIVNLSLGGCGIQTVVPLCAGSRAEILLRVNATSLRVVGEVQSLRAPFQVGIEFLLLSSCGKELLAELLRELAKQQAMATLHSASRRPLENLLLPAARPALLEGLIERPQIIAPQIISPHYVPQRAIQPPIIEVVPVMPDKRPPLLRADEIDIFI